MGEGFPMHLSLPALLIFAGMAAFLLFVAFGGGFRGE